MKKQKMLNHSNQNNPFHFVSPSPWPSFDNVPLFFNDIFVGLQNILSSFIVNNLWYCYLFLIFIFSILLTILLFILVSHAQKGYSVKMNNLPNNENSKKRKSENENENSRKKRKSENGDSGSPNESKLKLFFSKEDEETNSYRRYMVKYETYRIKNKFDPRGTEEQVKDTFSSLYSEYKKYKGNNPELEWEKLTDIYYCTWNKLPFGCKIYSDTDQSFAAAFKNLKIGRQPMSSALWKKAMKDVDYTTFEKYIKIIDNVVNKIGK
ncbi:hypothetical protein Aspvir_mt0036 (mitochondrion) [Aspergillus viridinutans]|nr:hypothetical protein Aspvir_mt0036 [Aspergillus viridinutans]